MPPPPPELLGLLCVCERVGFLSLSLSSIQKSKITNPDTRVCGATMYWCSQIVFGGGQEKAFFPTANIAESWKDC